MATDTSRDRILFAARLEFADHGFAGARIARIAAASGLNKQLIYYYFGSKAGLFGAATNVDAPPGTTSAGAEGVRASLRAVVQQLADRPELRGLLSDPSSTPATQEAAARWMRDARDTIASTISDGQGTGHFRDDVDPVRLAHHAVAMCVGFFAIRDRMGVAAGDWAQTAGDLVVRAAAW